MFKPAEADGQPVPVRITYVYSFELTGESTLVTLQLDEDRLTIRGPKEYRVDIDEIVGVKSIPEKGYIFDTTTQQRLRA